MYGQFLEVKGLAPIFKNKLDGFFVDVGAHDGVTASNTFYFEKRLGWRGICVEPHRGYFQRLKKNRPLSLCLDIAVWDKNLDAIQFYATSQGGWSRPEKPGRFPVVAVYEVETRTLDRILFENGANEIDLLSVDVEGCEKRVLNGFTIEDWLPQVIIIEDLSKAGQFDEYFAESEYEGVYGWKQGVGGSNVIYCRDPRDTEIVKRSWRR